MRSGRCSRPADGIGWTADPYPSTADYQALLRAAATTSKAPALFTWWSGQQLDPLVQAGAVANLTADVKVWEAKYGLNPGVEKAYEVNGQYYGAPLYTADWVVFYNKTDYAKYHLSVPTTWAQLASNVAVLRSKGISPFTYNVDDWAGFIWFEQILDEQDPSAYQALVNGQDLVHQCACGGGYERVAYTLQRRMVCYTDRHRYRDTDRSSQWVQRYDPHRVVGRSQLYRRRYGPRQDPWCLLHAPVEPQGRLAGDL